MDTTEKIMSNPKVLKEVLEGREEAKAGKTEKLTKVKRDLCREAVANL